MKKYMKLLVQEKIFFIVLMLCILAYGFFLRVYDLGNQSYWIDEGFSIMQAEAISQNGYPLLNSGEIEHKDVLFGYILSPLSSLSENHFAMRIISVVVSVLSIIAIFFYSKNLWNLKVAIISTLFLTFSYWHIVWARQVRPYSMLVLFILLVFFSIALYEKTKKNCHLYLALFFIILAFFSKSQGIIIFPAFIVYLLMHRKYVAMWFVAFALGIGMFYYRSFIIDIFNQPHSNYLLKYVLEYFWKYFGIFFSIAIIGWYAAFRKDIMNRRLHIFNLIFFLSALIYFSFFVYVYQARYLFLVTPLIFIYSAYCIALISSKNKKIIAVIILVFAIDFFTAKSITLLPKSNYALESYTPQPDFKKAYYEIEKVMDKEKDIIISPYPYLDLIYLNKSSYAIPISYTGRDEDSTRLKRVEHYSGTKMLYWSKNVDEFELRNTLKDKGTIFFIIDGMARSRISSGMREFLEKNGELLYADEKDDSQKIQVYRLDNM